MELAGKSFQNIPTKTPRKIPGYLWDKIFVCSSMINFKRNLLTKLQEELLDKPRENLILWTNANINLERNIGRNLEKPQREVSGEITREIK